MYIDQNTEQGQMVGKYYIFKERLETLCCSKVFKPGDKVFVQLYTSKNRLLVKDVSNRKGGVHKIKRSSLNRVAKEHLI